MPTVLIAPAPLRHQPGRFREILARAGFDRFVEPDGAQTLTEDELRRSLPGIDAMIAGGERITADLMDLAPALRVIARTGVGYDAVDLRAADARKIPVVITPGTNQESVAEHAFALLLALARQVVHHDLQVKAGGWERPLPRPLRGLTLGLVGLGRIGRAMATRAHAFGMTLLAHDPVAPPDPAFEDPLALRRVDLDTLLARSDVVSLHLPLVPDTIDLMDARAFARMKPGSYLINTSRGGLVVEPDLAAALRSGHLAGAGLDVFQLEPPGASNPLLSLPSVVASPHLGGIDSLAMADMAAMAATAVADLKAGRWPVGCVVNDHLAPGWTW